jgi:hypothetical protein
VLDGISERDSAGSGSGSACFLVFEHACIAGSAYVVDITVSNNTAGVTTASVEVRPAAQ